jgi:putative peptidoglycan lipid II flippase
LFGVAIASATLPAISRSAATGNMEEFRKTLSQSLGLVFLLTVPSAAGLVILGRSMIGAIYQHGKFGTYDTQQTATALSFYAVGLAGYAALKVLTPAFYALRDSRTPMMISFFSIVINFAVASTVIKTLKFGHAGLALSTSVVALFGFVLLFWILRGRIGGINGRALVASTGKITVASAFMAAATWCSSHWVHRLFGFGTAGNLSDLAISIPFGLCVFYAACRVLKVSELEMATSAVAGPLLRRLRR